MGKTQQHWENIFLQQPDEQKSWYQPYPTISIEVIEDLHLHKEAAIVDVGGGDSRLADVLLEKGYKNITVLDISAKAIENSKKRLGKKAGRINWVVGDMLDYTPVQRFDLWHDRAAFHFLTIEEEIKRYIQVTERSIRSSGYLIVGTFSENGPKKCSGLEIRQYSQVSMPLRFEKKFTVIQCKEENHITPSKILQKFIFCSFKKTET